MAAVLLALALTPASAALACPYGGASAADLPCPPPPLAVVPPALTPPSAPPPLRVTGVDLAMVGTHGPVAERLGLRMRVGALSCRAAALLDQRRWSAGRIGDRTGTAWLRVRLLESRHDRWAYLVEGNGGLRGSLWTARVPGRTGAYAGHLLLSLALSVGVRFRTERLPIRLSAFLGWGRGWAAGQAPGRLLGLTPAAHGPAGGLRFAIDG
ncbi:MAG: hypothetical protein ACFCGT_26145 [Sandaracinaceae bacterium]